MPEQQEEPTAVVEEIPGQVENTLESPPPLRAVKSALLAAQDEFPEIPKDQKATVKHKSGGQHSYRYASLDVITSLCFPILRKHGLLPRWTTERVDERVLRVTFLLDHPESGETLENALEVVYTMIPQELASSITYLRRYCCGPLLGIVPDEDDDGGAAQRGARERQEQTQARRAEAGKPPKQEVAAAASEPEPPRAAAAPKQSQPVATGEALEAEVMGLLARHGSDPGRLFGFLRKLEQSEAADWQPGTEAFGLMVSLAGQEVEALIQKGEWREEECGDLLRLLDALRNHEDLEQQAKGLF